MKKLKTFYVMPGSLPVILAEILVILSAAVKLALSLHMNFFGVRVVLLLAVAGWFVLITAKRGKELFYRSAVPAAAICLLLVSPGNVKWLSVLTIVVYIAVILFYGLAVSGILKKTAAIPAMIVSTALILVFKLKGGAALPECLPDALAVCGFLLLLAAMKEHDDGAYHRFWGDRPDGRLVRSLDPMTYVGIYAMPVRNGAHTMFADTLDVTEMDHYIHAKRREDIPHLSALQIFLTAYCRAIAECPMINRFISGQKIYSRDGDIVFNMTIKKKMTIDGEETVVKLHLTPEETLYTVSEKVENLFAEGRKGDDLEFDNVAGIIRIIPGLLKKFVFWLLKLLDYFGLIPEALLEVSPFHGSIFFTSMASLGIPPVYHHLYDFGNLPVFLCMGDKYKRKEPKDDGSFETRKYMKYTVVSDERICDGFCYSRALKAFKRYLQHPELLEQPPETVKHDVP